MRRTRRNLIISIDLLQMALLRARASHESTQQILQDTRLQVSKLLQQVTALQQQLDTLYTQQEFSRTSTAGSIG
jgi:hypothetical protein